MSDQLPMQVTFGVPSQGWLPVRLEARSGICTHQVSDVPGNILSGFVGALIRIALGSQEEQIEWSLEPDYWRWSFRVDAEVIEFRADGPGSDNLLARMPRREALASLCRGLLRLASCSAWDRDDAATAVWSWEFPRGELATLRRLVSDV